MAEKPHYLYKLTNNVNGKVYIGVSHSPETRLKQHLSAKRNNLVSNAVRKYGKECFSFKVICCGSQNYIYELERKAISLFNSTDSKFGYNICQGGFGNTVQSVDKRSDDSAVFVSGFWFPSKRFALKALGITLNTFNYRKFTGTLGEVTDPERKSNAYMSNLPTYFRGFWFRNRQEACDKLNITMHALKRCLNSGKLEENSKIKAEPFKKFYLVEGKEFTSLKQASKELEIPLGTLRYRYKVSFEGYGFILKQEQTYVSD